MLVEGKFLYTEEGTSEMKRITRRPRVLVTGDGKDVVGHAGVRVLCDLADELGLTEGLSAAMAPDEASSAGP